MLLLSNPKNLFPSFDDEPKSRFMDEIAHTTEGDVVKSPERKRVRTGSKSNAKDKDKTVVRDAQEESKEYKPEGEQATSASS